MDFDGPSKNSGQSCEVGWGWPLEAGRGLVLQFEAAWSPLLPPNPPWKWPNSGRIAKPHQQIDEISMFKDQDSKSSFSAMTMASNIYVLLWGLVFSLLNLAARNWHNIFRLKVLCTPRKMHRLVVCFSKEHKRDGSWNRKKHPYCLFSAILSKLFDPGCWQYWKTVSIIKLSNFEGTKSTWVCSLFIWVKLIFSESLEIEFEVNKFTITLELSVCS